MSHSIKTRVHMLASNFDPLSGRTGAEVGTVQEMMEASSYVIDETVLNLIERPDVEKSINAVVNAGIAKLPISPMLVEFEQSGMHHFVLLKEIGDEIQCKSAVLDLQGTGMFDVIFKGAAYVMGDPLFVRITPSGYILRNAHKDTLGKIQVCHALIALDLSILFLNIQGIEKDVVDCHRLNKQRVARGKPSIPRHTVVRIGTVYNKHGIGQKVSGRGGWTMPIHIRAGHVRHQRIGKGRTETKLVYIAPILVNYKPESGQPKPVINRYVKK